MARAPGKGVALATVVTTWGSSPRPAGAKLGGRRGRRLPGLGLGRLRRGRGHRGGAGIDQGRQAAAARFRRQQRAGLGSRPRLRRQDRRSSSSASNEGPLSSTRVLAAEPRRPRGRARHRPQERPRRLFLDGDGGRRRRWRSTTAPAGGLRRALRDGRNTTVETAERPRSSSRCSARRARCFIVGAVHIAQPLAPMAATPAISSTVVDPRSAFATDERFPGVELSTEWPDEALERLKPDRRTASSPLTHDPEARRSRARAALRSERSISARSARGGRMPSRLERLAEPASATSDFAAHPRAGRARYRRDLAGRDRGLDPGQMTLVRCAAERRGKADAA